MQVSLARKENAESQAHLDALGTAGLLESADSPALRDREARQASPDRPGRSDLQASGDFRVRLVNEDLLVRRDDQGRRASAGQTANPDRQGPEDPPAQQGWQVSEVRQVCLDSLDLKVTVGSADLQDLPGLPDQPDPLANLDLLDQEDKADNLELVARLVQLDNLVSNKI